MLEAGFLVVCFHKVYSLHLLLRKRTFGLLGKRGLEGSQSLSPPFLFFPSSHFGGLPHVDLCDLPA